MKILFDYTERGAPIYREVNAEISFEIAPTGAVEVTGIEVKSATIGNEELIDKGDKRPGLTLRWPEWREAVKAEFVAAYRDAVTRAMRDRKVL